MKRNLACTALLSIALASTAGAQQERAGTIEEITVTAQKREASLQEVPVSVAAISEEQIIKGAILTFEDYARGVPGLSFSQSGRFSRGGNVPQIRGIAQIGIHPVNAFMIDETPLQPQEFERVGVPDPNMFDIERIEILRGPQGDVYGSSAMGGVIKVVTNKPDPTAFEARVAGSFSTITSGGDSSEISAMLNLPIVEDRVAVRLTGQQARDGGYIDLIPHEIAEQFQEDSAIFQFRDNVNEADTMMFRAAVQWDVTDSLRITPSVFYQKVEEDRGRFVATNLSRQAGRYVDVDYGIDEFADNSFTVGNVLIEYEIGAGELISSSTYFELDWENILGSQGIACNFFGACADPTAALIDSGDEWQFTQEFRYASSLDGPLNFIVGAFYRDVEDEFAQLGIANSLTDIVGTNLIFLKVGEVERVEERALFGQLTWSFTDSLELAVGARWFDYERDRLTPTTSGLFGFPERNTGAEEDGVLPTVSLTYSMNDDSIVYARAAEGFRPGFGFATIFPPPCTPELERLGIDPDSGVGQVDSDSVWTYELGTKTSWLGNRVVVNAAAYHTDWEDIHARIGLNCGFGLDQNAGTAEVDGAELEIQAVLADVLDVSLAVGYTDAQFSENVPAIGASEGDPLPEVPEWAFRLMSQYNFPTFGGNGYVRADYTYNDDSRLQIASASALDTLRKPSIGLLGMRLGVDYDEWQFAVFAKNLLDERELDLCPREVTFRNTRPETSTCALKPREFGVYLSRTFR